MIAFRSWAASLADGIRHRNTRTLADRVDWLDGMAQSVARNPQPPRLEQLEQQASAIFRSPGAEDWSSFAANHISALVAASAGRKKVCYAVVDIAVHSSAVQQLYGDA
jgi:hypothetical protein